MLAGQAQQAPGVAEELKGMVAAVAGGYTEPLPDSPGRGGQGLGI